MSSATEQKSCCFVFVLFICQVLNDWELTKTYDTNVGADTNLTGQKLVFHFESVASILEMQCCAGIGGKSSELM